MSRTARRDSAPRRWRRLGVLTTGFAAAVALVVLALSTLLPHGSSDSALAVVTLIQETLARRPDPDVPRIVFLGDSTARRRQRPKGVPQLLRERLALTSARAQVDALTYRGLNHVNYYFLADLIVDSEPQMVVMPINFRSFRESDDVEGRPEIAGFMAPHRLGNALTLLPFLGLPADHLFLYVGFVEAGAVGPWQWLATQQERVGALWKRAQRFSSLAHGSSRADQALRAAIAQREANRWLESDRLRYHEAGARRAYGPVLAGIEAGHPALRVLGATLARFAEAEIPVLIYSVPINLDHIRRLGIRTHPGLEITSKSIAETVAAHGGSFMDLHSLLPDAAFTNATHFDTPPPEDGLAKLAHALAPEVRAVLGTAARAKR